MATEADYLVDVMDLDVFFFLYWHAFNIGCCCREWNEIENGKETQKFLELMTKILNINK